MELRGIIYISGKLKQDVDIAPNTVLDNPFGEGKIYKTDNIGKWTFDGKIELLGKEAIIKDTQRVTTGSKTKSSHTMPNQNYDFLKTYDYTKVDHVLERNTNENFKTISKIEVRRHLISSEELVILELILLTNS